MKKLFASIVIFTMIVGLLAGCGTNEPQKSGNESTNEATATMETSNYPLTIKDATGADVTLDKKPVKIASITLSTDEILMEIVEKDRIAALTNYADDPGVSNIIDKAKEIEGRIESNAEKVIALGPDLALVPDYSDKNFIEQLKEAKIPVYACKTAYNIEDIKKLIVDVSTLVDEKENGQQLVKWMDDKLKAVEDKLTDLKEEEKLTCLDTSELNSTSGSNTTFDEIVTKAGLVNAAAKAGVSGWPELSKEKIVEWNPDIIFVPGWFYDQKQNTETFTNNIKTDKSLADVKAVKNDKVFALPYAHVSSISQYIVLAVEDAANAAYPELFK